MSRDSTLERRNRDYSAGILMVILFFAAVSIARAAPPAVRIDSPPGAVTVDKGQPLALRGRGTDPAAGAIADQQLVWASDRDGPLGHGPSIEAKLSAGTHTVSLTATGVGGEMALATVGVTVGKP
jgi:hypothetical protein